MNIARLQKDLYVTLGVDALIMMSVRAEVTLDQVMTRGIILLMFGTVQPITSISMENCILRDRIMVTGYLTLMAMDVFLGPKMDDLILKEA